MKRHAFLALAQLLRMHVGPTRDVVRIVLVDGQRVSDAARAIGLDYKLAHKAVQRARRGLVLAQIVADISGDKN